MKKLFFLIFMIICLTACEKIDYKISIGDLNEANLYIPEIIKNNSVLIGYEVIDDEDLKTVECINYNSNKALIYKQVDIYPSLSYDLLKNYTRNNKVYLRAKYREYEDEELFAFNLLENNNYSIEKTELVPYPREITIPESFENLKITEVSKFGFYGINELIFVHLPDTIEYLDRYAFSNTNLKEINYTGLFDETVYSNTLIRNDFRKIELNIIENSFIKTIQINDLLIEVIIDLDGGKIIKEELDLVIARPHLENEIFICYENEEGRKIEIPKEQAYLSFSIKDYYKHIVGLNYNIITKKITDEIFKFTYLQASDTYSLALVDEELALSKLVLPDTYLGKKITQINAFNNKNVSEVSLGKYVEAINCFFNTPNLKRIVFNEGLKKLKPYAFCGTLLSDIFIPTSLKRLEIGVFAYTFIKDFKIPKGLEYIDGSAFARCLELKYSSENDLFKVSSDNIKVYYENNDYLVLYSSSYFEEIDLKGIKKLGAGVFAFCVLSELINYENLEYIDNYAFYNGYLSKQFLTTEIAYISENAFLKLIIENK